MQKNYHTAKMIGMNFLPALLLSCLFGVLTTTSLQADQCCGTGWNSCDPSPGAPNTCPSGYSCQKVGNAGCTGCCFSD